MVARARWWYSWGLKVFVSWVKWWRRLQLSNRDQLGFMKRSDGNQHPTTSTKPNQILNSRLTSHILKHQSQLRDFNDHLTKNISTSSPSSPYPPHPLQLPSGLSSHHLSPSPPWFRAQSINRSRDPYTNPSSPLSHCSALMHTDS